MPRNGHCCAVFGCRSTSLKLKKWKEAVCDIHPCEKHMDCPCLLPFSFHTFPKNEELKKEWLINVNRRNYKPSKYAKVCSIHFVDGRPTTLNPIPYLSLGYNTKVPVRTIIAGAIQGRRIIKKLQPNITLRKKRKCGETLHSEDQATVQDDKSSVKMALKAVENFRAYIRCNTMHPNPDYSGAMKFLTTMAEDIGLNCEVFELVKNNSICLMTWKGRNRSIPSILLNSHTDVVPVFPEHWKHDPFGAVLDDDGNIYGRGTQDMKCVGIQYLEAIRILKGQGIQPERDVHLSFVPDEEVGGLKGMVPLIASPRFKQMNVGFALDEGLASPTDTFLVYYGERNRFVVHVKAVGKPGHGSQFIEDTAGEKIAHVINKFLEFRNSEKMKMIGDPKLTLGDVTTSNLTIIQGGVQTNVVPSEITAMFDVRVSPSRDPDDFKHMVLEWTTAAGVDPNNVHIEFFGPHSPLTVLDDTNPWWKAFSSACNALGIKTKQEIFPAATDSRYIRQAGISAIGFSPMNHTPVLLHDHNEFLNRDVFLKGIDIYVKVLEELINVL